MRGVWEMNRVMINQGLYLINLVRVGAPTLNRETLLCMENLVYESEWLIWVIINQGLYLINLVRMAMPKLNYGTL